MLSGTFSQGLVRGKAYIKLLVVTREAIEQKVSVDLLERYPQGLCTATNISLNQPVLSCIALLLMGRS